MQAGPKVFQPGPTIPHEPGGPEHPRFMSPSPTTAAPEGAATRSAEQPGRQQVPAAALVLSAPRSWAHHGHSSSSAPPERPTMPSRRETPTRALSDFAASVQQTAKDAPALTWKPNTLEDHNVYVPKVSSVHYQRGSSIPR